MRSDRDLLQGILGREDGAWDELYARYGKKLRRPGLVFPRAVDIGEQELLRDVDSRLFVGLGAE